MGQPQGEPARRLLRQADHEFQPEGALEFRIVFALQDGRAETVTLTRGSRTFNGRRQP